MWEVVAKIINDYSVISRVKFRDASETNWSDRITFPTNGYAELSEFGPFLMGDVIQIEIDPIELKKEGKLLPLRKIDHTSEIEEQLTSAGIKYSTKNNIYILL